jgi:hypothetical protein
MRRRGTALLLARVKNVRAQGIEIDEQAVWTWGTVKKKNQIEILKMIDEGIPQVDIAKAIDVSNPEAYGRLNDYQLMWYGEGDVNNERFGNLRTALWLYGFYPTKDGGVFLGGLRLEMWKAFVNATQRHAPQAAILYDKFHVMRHLNDALDKVRKSEYARLAAEDRQFIKGQKYTLLSHRENLTLDGRRS